MFSKARSKMLGVCAVATALSLLSGCFLFQQSSPSEPSTDCVEVGDGVAAPPDAKKPFLWIGTNAEDGSYRTIAEGEKLPMQFGPQGGQHVWGAARVYAPKDGGWTLTFSMKTADGNEVGAFSTFVDGCAGEVAEQSSATGFLNDEMPVTGVLSVDATPEGGGAALHAEVPVSVE
jgi:hypothetical protein